MPPGYLVILGLVFKIFGLSLDVARRFSLLSMLSAMVLLGLIIKRYKLPLLSLLLVIPFVLGAPFIASGNIARMEALLLLLVLAAFVLMQRGRLLAGIGVLLLTPLVHPNGVYFLLAGVIAGWCMKSHASTPHRRLPEIVLLAFVVLCWIGYGVFAGLHWSAFIQDMGYQFQRKTTRDILSVLLTRGSVSLIIIVLLGGAYCYWKKVSSALLLAIAVPAWWAALSGKEMWYGVFFGLSFYLLLVFFLNLAIHVRQYLNRLLLRNIVTGAIIFVTFWIVGWNARHAPSGDPLLLGDPRLWCGMQSSPLSYLTEVDRDVVTLRLLMIPRTRTPLLLQVNPIADAFFFSQLRDQGIAFNCPKFSTKVPDWYLIHLSRLFPNVIDQLTTEELKSANLDPCDFNRYIIRSRDSTECWVLVQAPDGK